MQYGTFLQPNIKFLERDWNGSKIQKESEKKMIQPASKLSLD